MTEAELKVGGLYEYGTGDEMMIVEVTKITDSTVFFRIPDTGDKPVYVRKNTFISRSVAITMEQVMAAVEKDLAALRELPNEPVMDLMAKGQWPAVTKPSDMPVTHGTVTGRFSCAAPNFSELERPKTEHLFVAGRQCGKSTMVAALTEKWAKKFKKDLRYGSRKAKTEARRALGA